MKDIPLKDFYKDMHLAAVISEAVSHKLNNSLSGILGYLQFAIEKMDKDSLDRDEIAKLIGFLNLAREESLFSKDLMHELRWFSKQYLFSENADKPSHSAVIKNLKLFWNMVSEVKNFRKVNIAWDESKKHEAHAIITKESLFCLFYICILSIVKVCNEQKKIDLSIHYGSKDSMFTDMVFNFQASEQLSKNELRQSFVLASALIKSLYSKIEFEVKEYDVKIVISLPRKVEKV